MTPAAKRLRVGTFRRKPLHLAEYCRRCSVIGATSQWSRSQAGNRAQDLPGIGRAAAERLLDLERYWNPLHLGVRAAILK